MWKKTQRNQCKLYAHHTTHGAVWAICSTEFGFGNSMVMSVCSDGSVLTACSKDALSPRLKGQKRNFKVQLFRLCSVERGYSGGHDASPAEGAAPPPSSPKVTTLLVDCSLGTVDPHQSSPQSLSSPPIALHRITSCNGIILTRKSNYGRYCTRPSCS